MSPALFSMAPRLNDNLFRLPIQDQHVPPVPPSPPDPTHGSVAMLADDFCGTVPHHLPVPTPAPSPDPCPWLVMSGDGYCGTVLRHLPFPPPPPPEPWADLGARAQSFR
jgi:hypothetical protein